MAEYYCFDFARLPDKLYKANVPLADWQKHLTTAGKDGFKDGELGTVAPIRWGAFIERSITFPLYMLLNAVPLALPLLLGTVGWRRTLKYAAAFIGVDLVLKLLNPMRTPKTGQYFYTERNIQKYNSIKWVYPKALHPPNIPGPKIFCVVPHGLAPCGIVAYPGWSKLFGERMNHPTAAPAVLRLPIVGYFLKSIGYIPAESKSIKKALNKEESVSLVLDGIAGMFQNDASKELAWVKERKGIVKIALTTGVPLVPAFGFGHSQLWRILTDPFGILEKISVKLNVSIVPFCGRPFGLLPFGPPYRTPVTVAFGEPIIVPKVEDPSKEQIEEYHNKFMESLTKAFETHKSAYGWPQKVLKLV